MAKKKQTKKVESKTAGRTDVHMWAANLTRTLPMPLREQMAFKFAEAIIANGVRIDDDSYRHIVAYRATKTADALLAELAKPKKDK